MKEFNSRTPLIALLALHLVIALLACFNTLFIADEFQVASFLVNFREGLTPYLDFSPYKNVLGYYFLTPLFSSFTNIPNTLIGMRIFIFGIFLFCFYVYIFELKKHLKPAFVLIALFSYICLTNIQVNSANLRVDGLTAASLCIVLFLILRGHLKTASFVIAISFLANQKAAFYVMSWVPAFFIHSYLAETKFSVFLKKSIAHGAIMLLPLIIYYGIFLKIGDPALLFNSSIKESATMGLTNTHSKGSEKYWLYFAKNYWVFFSLCFYGCIQFLIECKNWPKSTRFFMLFSVFNLIHLAAYKSPWPYNFNVFLPAAIPVFAFAVQKILQVSKTKQWKSSVFVVLILLNLPLLFIYRGLTNSQIDKQVHDLNLASYILPKEASYISSANFLYNNPPGLPNQWLTGNFREANKNWNDEQISDYLLEIKKRKPKLILLTRNLINLLHPETFASLQLNYAPYWSSIYTLNLKVSSKNKTFTIDSTNFYKLHIKNEMKISINGQSFKNDEIVFLREGEHSYETTDDFNLQWFPDAPNELIDSRYEHKNLFPTSYQER